nr:DUF11 domain-containing protein [Calothrix sp. MO_167.B12]
VNVDNNAPSSVTNNVSVSGGGEPTANNGNNTGSDITNIIPIADLSVTKTDNQTSTTPGSAITYTITVSNNGPSTVNSLTLNDTVPASIENPIFTPSTGSYNNNTGAWTGLNLASGQSITLTIQGTVASTATGTITNTATVASPSGTTDPDNSNNSSTDTTTVTNATSNPNVLLVKRITAINGDRTKNPNDNTPLNTFVDDTTSSKKDDDNNSNWPSNYLIGAIDGGKVKPGEEVEYTIYFLSTGDNTAKSVLMCDFVPENMTFLPTAFNSSPAAATATFPGADRGIVHSYNSNTVSNSGIQDGDISQYFPPGVEPSTVYPNIDCDGDPNTNLPNTNGAVVVNLGDLPHATTPGQSNSYGFVRFRGKVK